jgi:formylmethanofuran dehydrogenase subunit E
MLLRTFVCLCLAASAAVCLAHDPSAKLPPPRYQPKESDPAWLTQTVQLHGHLGPWVVAGARLGMAGAHAVNAKAHFDVDVTCEGPFVKPPESCFLDGVQIGSGATLGKRNLHYVEAKQVVLKIQNPRTKKIVEVRPSRKLMDLLAAPVPKSAGPSGDKPADAKAEARHEEEYVEQLARDIAAMPEEELLTISRP